MFFEFTKAGQLIKSLCAIGKGFVTEEMVEISLYSLNPKERKEFHSAHHWMPGWLSDIVHARRFSLLTGAIQNESLRQGKFGAEAKLVLVPWENPLVLQL